MKLSKIKICNYRSFGENEVVINFNDLTSFIGHNSSGKTAAISALQKLFGNTSIEKILCKSDFHISANEDNNIESKSLYIEAVFTFPELNQNNEKNISIPLFFEKLTVNDDGKEPYLRIRLEATWNKGCTLEGTIDSKIYYITESEDQDTIQDCNKHNISQKELDRINLIYIPAVRNPSSQLKNVSGSILYRFLSNINWSSEFTKDIEDKINILENELYEQENIRIIKEAIKIDWQKYHDDNRYNYANLKFNSSDLTSMLKKAKIEFSPTYDERAYNVDELGDGLKSLFYISMVNSLLTLEEELLEKSNQKNEDTEEENSFNLIHPACTILAIEEPENHISPHLLGKIIKNIKEIADKKNCQVIISSHSPSIVKRIEPENIRHFRIDKKNDTEKTIVNKLDLPTKKNDENLFKYIKNGIMAYPELYFSKLVILGEGDSEEILLPKILELAEHDIDSNSISIVPLGGRHVNYFWKLLNQLNIPYITLLDLDRERYLGGWGRIKYVCDQLIENKQISEFKLLYELECEEDFDKMHEWDVTNTELMNKWIKYLENYNIYFSSPLDIDFLMLKHFKDQYLNTIENNQGPQIKTDDNKIQKIKNIEDKSSKKYKEKLNKSIERTLKEKSTDGNTFTKEEKELMIWYEYLFLTRGKPTTHRIVLSHIDDDYFKENMPEVFKNINLKINKLTQNIKQ